MVILIGIPLLFALTAVLCRWLVTGRRGNLVAMLVSAAVALTFATQLGAFTGVAVGRDQVDGVAMFAIVMFFPPVAAATIGGAALGMRRWRRSVDGRATSKRTPIWLTVGGVAIAVSGTMLGIGIGQVADRASDPWHHALSPTTVAAIGIAPYAAITLLLAIACVVAPAMRNRRVFAVIALAIVATSIAAPIWTATGRSVITVPMQRQIEQARQNREFTISPRVQGARIVVQSNAKGMPELTGADLSLVDLSLKGELDASDPTARDMLSIDILAAKQPAVVAAVRASGGSVSATLALDGEPLAGVVIHEYLAPDDPVAGEAFIRYSGTEALSIYETLSAPVE